jgi:DNA recombination protein RmuC
MVILLLRRSPGLIDLRELTVQTQTLKSDLERIQRTIRDDHDRSVNSAEDRGKALRAEVSEATSRSTTTLVSSLAAVGEAQKAQLESFATVLASSTKTVDDRLAGISEQQQRTLTDFARANTEGAKALRDEVGAALKAVGDDLRQTAGQAAELQHNQLDSFAQQLREGVKVLDERMETLRLAVDQKTNHLIQTLVSKLDNAQETHAQQGKALREEVSASLKSVGDDLRLSAANAANVQRTQLEAFAIQLTEGLSGIDGRMEALRQIVDQKIIALMEGISGRFDSAREASTAAGKALREEVQTTLKTVGDDLRMNAEVAASTQKDQLREVSTKIVELSEGIGQRFESFRQVTEAKLTEMRQDAGTAAKELREEVTNTLNKVGEDLRENAKRVAEEQRIALEAMSKRMSEIGEASQRGQEKLRESVAEGLTTLRRENDQKLEQMRQTVDEKLQGTLEKRLGESFNLVTQQLKQVHEGLGDMRKLATGVGDLKRVLTNVKSRGTWGETQLAAILEDMLAPNQYARNVRIKDGSNETVEFCVKIPLLDEHQENVLLPIDAKFPTEDYERLMTAAEAGDPGGTEQAAQKLETRFRACAKEIYTKYISPPRTTDYAVMYVPSEGLYAEIVKRPGLISAITREFTVVVAGPTNLTAILNAVHAVSRSVAIQHKAGEIAALLLKVQGEFVKYGEAVSTAKKRAVSTVKAMESLDTRQKAMGRALSGVSSIGGIAATVQLTGPVLDLAIDEMADDDSDDELLYMNEGDKIGELRNVDLVRPDAI